MKSTVLKIMLLVGTALVLANCSKDSDSSSHNGYNCGSGNVYTSQGCLPSAQCVNQGGGGWNGYQCLPQQYGGYGNTLPNGMVCTSVGALPVGSCNRLPQFNQASPNYGQSGASCYPAINPSACQQYGGYQTGYQNGYNQYPYYQ